MVKRALRGSWVPASELHRIAAVRRANGQPYLVTPFGRFEDDADRLETIRMQAASDFHSMEGVYGSYLEDFNAASAEGRVEKMKQARTSLLSVPDSEKDKVYQECGEWFADYLKANDYAVHLASPTFKQL